jgi:hypothetical protein
MAYEQKISTAKPGCIVYAMDDSGSMADPLLGTSDAKHLWVERLHGCMLKELLARSTDMKGDTPVIKPRYFLSHIIYGAEPQVWGEEIMNIEETVKRFAQGNNSLGLGGHLGGTDTVKAFRKSFEILGRVVKDERFKDSFPPMLLHLTDGESQTDAQAIAQDLMKLSTTDGNVLVVNAYIGTRTSLKYQGPEDFPGYLDAAEAGPSEDNIRMFQMSSEMPECIQRNLIDDGIFPKMRAGARLFFDVRTKDMLKHALQVVGSIGSRADRNVR